MSHPELIVEADGASRGNPGDAAGGAVVIDPVTHDVVVRAGILCGVASNNVAEYRGMLEGVKCALEINPEVRLHIRMDSKLVVEQMSGRWKIKHPDMQVLATQARELLAGTAVTFEWIPREENSRADAAANKALDGKQSYVER